MGESGRTRVVADMRVTDRWDTRRGYPIAVLNSVILSETVLVAFAGNVLRALASLRQVPPRPVSVDDVLPILGASAKAAGSGAGRVEYSSPRRPKDFGRSATAL
jgi:hypothetical protein